jgi:hypothetical protein
MAELSAEHPMMGPAFLFQDVLVARDPSRRIVAFDGRRLPLPWNDPSSPAGSPDEVFLRHRAHFLNDGLPVCDLRHSGPALWRLGFTQNAPKGAAHAKSGVI